MKVAAIITIGDYHPMLEECLVSISKIAELYIRIDGSAKPMPNGLIDNIHPQKVILTSAKWDRGNFREDALRMLDDVKPDIVLQPDHDEIFDGKLELEEFMASPYEMMFFDYFYPMPTDDGRDIPELKGKPYPSLPHCKAFKWRQGLSFAPYMGLAQPTQYANKPYFRSKVKIKHYTMWTKDMEEAKKEWVIKEYGIF